MQVGTRWVLDCEGKKRQVHLGIMVVVCVVKAAGTKFCL